MTTHRRYRTLVLFLVLLAGCAKKGDAAAPAAETVHALPPGAKTYVEVDVKSFAATALGRTFFAMLKSSTPPSCGTMFDAITRLAIAGYGEGADPYFFLPRKVAVRDGEPPAPAKPTPMVGLITGPSAAAMRTCFNDLGARNNAPPRVETRAGHEVLLSDETGMGFFSVSGTTQVIATVAQLDAALATAGGGPSLDGAPLLAALATVPSGALVATMEFPPMLADDVTHGLAALSGGKQVVAPLTLAASVSVGDTLTIVAAAGMPDEAAATTMEQVARTALAAARTMLAAAGPDPTGGKLKAVLDSLVIAHHGAVVTVRAAIPSALLSDMLLAARGHDRPRPAPPAPAAP